MLPLRIRTPAMTTCPPLDLMQSWVAVVEFESVSRAAVHLGVSQAAVSQHVQALEESIGISLLEVPGAGCCGAVRFHLNDQDAGREDMRALIDAWWPIASGREAEAIVMTDLRMGQTPWFAFSFAVAERRGDAITAAPVRQLATRRPPPAALAWLWRRIWDEDVPPPAYSSSQTRET